jgi:hypothetical protein
MDAILLIHKQLTNQISSRENKILKLWLKVDPQNRILHKDISMIWNASRKSFDPSFYTKSVHDYTRSVHGDESEQNNTLNHRQDVANNFQIEEKYKQLNPDQELTKSIINKDKDLFSQLMLSDLSPKQLEKLQNINFEVELKPILQILSSTAMIILSGEYCQYHLDVVGFIEQFSPVRGILISDMDDKVIYSTKKKFKNIYLLEAFPIKIIMSEKLNISHMKKYQLLALPVYHQYGRIGMVLLMI